MCKELNGWPRVIDEKSQKHFSIVSNMLIISLTNIFKLSLEKQIVAMISSNERATNRQNPRVEILTEHEDNDTVK